MPMPKPHKGERQNDFISRCENNLKEEFPDSEQRTAVCFSQWQESRGENKASGYSIKAQNGIGEILIYDEIGDGFFAGLNAKKFADDLKGIGKINGLDIRINSPGGSVFEGVAIYNTIKRHPARKRVYIDGLAASIASIIAMAGDEIHIAQNALMMIHDPWILAAGDANELRKQAELLDQVRGTILDTYVRRTKGDTKKISEMMANETWFGAGEAIELGFADYVMDENRMAAMTLTDFNFRKYHYKHMPEKLDNKIQQAKEFLDAPRRKAAKNGFNHMNVALKRRGLKVVET